MPARIDIPEDILYQKYIVEKLSASKIANELNCSPNAILSKLKKFNIPTRSNRESIIIDRGIDTDKNVLYKKYVIDKCTTYDIAAELNCSQSTILRHLNKYNIPTRNNSEAQIERRGNNILKKDLYKLYVIDKKSMVDISKIYNCNNTAIRHRLRKYNIPIRPYIDRSGSNNANWKGGVSQQYYCYKFNNTFKEYIREKFNRTCYICGKTEDELDRKLAVHHIDYNKSSICNGKEFAFVPLCHSCHAKTNGNRYYWFNLLINYWLDKYEIYNDLTMY